MKLKLKAPWLKIGKGFMGQGDCILLMKEIPSESIDVVITDPPYNYEFIGKDWDHKEITRRMERTNKENSSTIVKHVPYGSGLAGGKRNSRWYEKNAKNAIDYQAWMEEWCRETFRVCKPGAYVAVFNATRFLARTQVALENSGFYPRDVMVMKKQSGIPKGLNAVGMLSKRGVKDSSKWTGFHSALRNEWEGVVIVQKPLCDNYLETAEKFGTGLMRAQRDDGSFFSNIFDEKIPRRKKDSDNSHMTTKPEIWISHLVRLLTPPSKDSIILDPFFGSGTLGIVSEKLGINWIGIEIDETYFNEARSSIESLD